MGLFWEDEAKSQQHRMKNFDQWGFMPHVPDTGWRPPEFPNLSAAKVIGFDTETYDPELTEAGPGWGRGSGHIIGASLAVDDGSKWYFPIRHGIVDGRQMLPPEHAAMNMDPDHVLKFLHHNLKDNRPKVAANAIYDLGWLEWEGVKVGGQVYDPQFAEALLDSETPSVTLDLLSKKYLDVGKTTDQLYHWLSNWNKKPANSNQRKWLYRVPPCLAGPYAEDDALYPIKIIEKQFPLMAEKGVREVFDMETKLARILVAMRMKGAPVNVDKAEEVYDNFGSRMLQKLAMMKDELGFEVNPDSPTSMTKAFNTLGIPIPEKKHKATGEMVVSFDKDRLKEVEHPFAADVLHFRQLAKVRNTFMKGYIIDKNVNGRVYCSFHPLRGSENGARSGRLSSSDPNLQNIPARTEEGKLVREAFEVPVGHGRWRSFDYSSIEYRLLAHYAVGEGAKEVRAIYAADPKADYHTIVGKLIEKLTGLVLSRGKVKTINFGIIYGMALNALTVALGIPKAEAANLLEQYHTAAPYASATMASCAEEVHLTGVVRTIMGRVSDFNQWGSKTWQEEGRTSMSYQEAKIKYGMANIERQHTHKALNRKLQGSAADVMKKAMVDAWEAGLFEESACGMPILTVHDELDFEDKSDLDNPAWKELVHTMEHCMDDRLLVPLIVEGDTAQNWAGAH